ncbi:MAG TPA: hypothetical protein VN793_04635, partial [Acidimicrobiales bacterium]|nr:hypothetical protein [Acidimicrobiales bacterium]
MKIGSRRFPSITTTEVTEVSPSSAPSMSDRDLVPTTTPEVGRADIPLGLSTMVGLLGYGGMVVTGTRLGPLPNPPTGVWWFSAPAGHIGLLRVLFYVSTLLAVAGWVGVGTVAWRG